MKTTPKFRGKLLHSGEVVCGNLIESSAGTLYIIPSSDIEPDGHHLSLGEDKAYWAEPSTVEQIGGDVVEENKKLRELLENEARIISEYRHLSLSEIIPCLDLDTKAGMFVDQDVKEALKEK